MPIIAVSMSESEFSELEDLQKEGRFSSRSEAIRHAIQSLLVEHRKLEQAKGDVSLVISVRYASGGKDAQCSQIQHRYNHLITAMMHSHSTDGGCIDVMMVSGDADAIRALVKEIRAQKSVVQLQVNVVGG